MMKRRSANHARSSIFFKLKRNSPFLLHPKKVCLYFAYNSKCVCTWTVVREQGQPRVETRQLACERRKKSNFYSSHYSLISCFSSFCINVLLQYHNRPKEKSSMLGLEYPTIPFCPSILMFLQDTSQPFFYQSLKELCYYIENSEQHPQKLIIVLLKTIYTKYTSIYADECRRLFRNDFQSNIQSCTTSTITL